MVLKKFRIKKYCSSFLVIMLALCGCAKSYAMRWTNQDCEAFMYEHYVVFEESFKKELYSKYITLGFYIKYIEAVGSVVPPGNLPTIGYEVLKAWEFSEENSEDFIANLITMERTFLELYRYYHCRNND